MQFQERKLATLLAALRLFQLKFATEPKLEEVFADYFHNCPPLNSEEIDSLCEEINYPPAGYVVINLSNPLYAGDGKYDFYICGEDPVCYGNLEAAVGIVANLILEREDENTPAQWLKDTFGIYALHPVCHSQTDSLIDKAVEELRAEE